MKSTASEPGLIDHSNDVKMFKTEETGFTVFFFNILTSFFWFVMWMTMQNKCCFSSRCRLDY